MGALCEPVSEADSSWPGPPGAVAYTERRGRRQGFEDLLNTMRTRKDISGPSPARLSPGNLLVALTCLPLALGAAGLAGQEPPKDGSPPARSTWSVRVPQRKLGQQIEQAGESMMELIREVLQNIGVELKNRQKVSDASARLSDVGRRTVPKILYLLRDGSGPGLREAFAYQDRVSKELGALLQAVQGELAPAAARRVLGSAIRKQTEALERTRDARLSQPQLEGKAAAALSEEEHQALDEPAERQQEAAEEVERAHRELQQQVQSARAADPAAADAIRQALDVLDKTEAGQKAQEAAADIRENRLRRAEDRQTGVLGALRQADARLGQKPHREAQLQERLGALQDAARIQEHALKETRALDTRNEEALARTAQEQGQVSRQLGELRAQDTSLARAHQQSEAAKSALLRDDAANAIQNQESVLGLLQNAIQRAAQELAQTQAQLQQAQGQAQAQTATGQPPAIPTQAPGPAGATAPAAGRQHTAAQGGFEYGPLGAPAGSVNWDVALPPRERAEVEQAIREKMPARYRRHISLYYQNLAGAGRE